MSERGGDWLKQAEKDLQHAKNSQKFGDYEWACFAAQQSAEKGLKAVYILKFKRLWKIHDLVGLGRKVGAPFSILKVCEALNPYYIETRYPIEAECSEAQAKEALDNARKVVEWVRKKLHQR